MLSLCFQIILYRKTWGFAMINGTYLNVSSNSVDGIDHGGPGVPMQSRL